MKVSGGIPPVAAAKSTRHWRIWIARGLIVVLLGEGARPADAAVGIDVRKELECLALTLYFEARGEPEIGQIAVGHVVMNRAANPLFPAAVCDVVRQGGNKIEQGCQFTWWCDDVSNIPGNARAWAHSQTLARRIFWGYTQDPTAGALWYHADYVDPYWRTSFTEGPKIGRHIFYGLGRKTTLSDSAADARPPVLRR